MIYFVITSDLLLTNVIFWKITNVINKNKLYILCLDNIKR